MRGRLDKLVATAFQISRSQARDAIRSGRVMLNGTVCRDAAAQSEAQSLLSLDGRQSRAEQFFYLMMYKPQGVLSATRDGRQQTALDLLPAWYRRGGIVGRLDKDAEGLLLITNDGEMNHRLTSPTWHAPKRYMVRTDVPPGKDAAAIFAGGIDLGDFTSQPALLEVDPQDPTLSFATIGEGKFHQIKRMYASIGLHVVFLKRLSIGSLTLDPTLEAGGYRPLSEAEIQAIQEQIGNLMKNS